MCGKGGTYTVDRFVDNDDKGRPIYEVIVKCSVCHQELSRYYETR